MESVSVPPLARKTGGGSAGTNEIHDASAVAEAELMVPLPFPDALPVSVIHPALDVACHEQVPAVLVTVAAKLPPIQFIETAAGVTVYAHGAGGAGVGGVGGDVIGRSFRSILVSCDTATRCWLASYRSAVARIMKLSGARAEIE
jgi:hypothetical protein